VRMGSYWGYRCCWFWRAYDEF